MSEQEIQFGSHVEIEGKTFRLEMRATEEEYQAGGGQVKLTVDGSDDVLWDESVEPLLGIWSFLDTLVWKARAEELIEEYLAPAGVE